MPTIALVGAGRGLGAAVARRFGSEGFDLALISRNLERVTSLAADLTTEGYPARGYAANVRDPRSLAATLDQVTHDMGAIETLVYAPLPQKEFLRPVLETTVQDLQGAIEFSVFGPVAAVHQVLQGMRTIGHGTILFINGGSAVRPTALFAGTSIAFAGESAYARMLHDALAPEHIYVGQLIIPGAISEGHPEKDPGTLADKLWGMHVERKQFRVFAEPMDLD
ncbi:SDR family NAD(P)-dependent oxidoreductase [Microbacterium sp. P05]|uniref:SDR family NAD(P)-dependent oxidoreductase n=1 Tax=Microbacterium sp. P05 TaxID=3366948 RepID=UPI003745C83F